MNELIIYHKYFNKHKFDIFELFVIDIFSKNLIKGAEPYNYSHLNRRFHKINFKKNFCEAFLGVL